MKAKITKNYYRSETKSIGYNKQYLNNIFKEYQLYILIIPALAYIIVFHYIPMYGLQIAFRDFKSNLGFFGSEWVGLKHFINFINYPTFWRLIANTLGISLYSLIVGFPIPIIFAIMLNEVNNKFFKKTIQMATYAPHFISMVVMCGMIVMFLNQNKGMVNHILEIIGLPRINFMERPEWFKTVFVMSGIWQETGFASIIYIAALSGIDLQVVEAAKIDGANRLQKIWHVDIPGIMPIIITLFIFRVGQLLSVGFEKVLLLQNPLNMSSADVISTYIYRLGIVQGQFSYTTAIGLFNSLLNVILLITMNNIAKKVSQTSLW